MAEEAEYVADAVVVDDDPQELTLAPVQTTALVRRERRSEVIRPLPVAELVRSFHEYQDLLIAILDPSDYQAAGKDQDGKPRRFVKKSGWRKIATAFDLDVLIISDVVERNIDGEAVRAKVIARAIAPSGRSMDGDGYCDVGEKRFNDPRARQKLENDLRATATTRAKNRAIADLVGMGDVSAEEVGDGGAATVEQPVWLRPADKNQTARASRALTKLCGGDETRAKHEWGALKGAFGGTMPVAAAATVEHLAKVVVVGGTDPMFIDPTGDIPTEDQVEETVTDLLNLAIDAWTRLEGAEKARKRVGAVPRTTQALRAVLRAAQEAGAVAA